MAIYKRGSVWWMDVYVGADRRRVRKSTGCTDETQARIVEQTAVALNRKITTRQRAIAILDNLLPEEEHALPVVEMAEFYRAHENVEGQEEKGKRFRVATLGRFAQWALDHTRAKTVADVNEETAFAYSNAMKKLGKKAKTINNIVTELSASWKLYMQYGKASNNPWSVGRVPRRRDEEETGRALTDDEIARLLEESRKVGFGWEDATVVALYTGLRMKDVVNLGWESVDFGRNVVDLDPSKTKRFRIRVIIPMHPSLRAVLEARRGNGSPHVFPERCGKVRNADFRDGDCRYQEIIRRAGIVDGPGEKISFHCFRHTFTTRLADAGVPPDVRMALTGHTSVDTHAIYTHAEQAMRDAVAKLK